MKKPGLSERGGPGAGSRPRSFTRRRSPLTTSSVPGTSRRLVPGGDCVRDLGRGSRPTPSGNGADPDSLRLPRLLLLARLTPGQALVIAADLVASLRTSHLAGHAHQGFRPNAVSIGADGSTRLVTPPGATIRLTEDTFRADLASASAVLAQLADAATAYASNGSTSTSTSSAAADHTTPPDPLATLAQAIDAVADPDELSNIAANLRQASSGADVMVRRELARIVSSAAGLDPWPPVDAPDGRDAAPRRSTLAGRTTEGSVQPVAGSGEAVASLGPTRAGSRTRTSSTGRWAVAVAVLLAVVLVELTVLRGRIAQDIDLLLEAGRAADATTDSEPRAPAVVPPAPASAGVVLGVDVRALGRCVPSAPCEVRVLIQLAADASSHRVRWNFRVVERCTGWVADLPGGELAVEPGGRAAAAVVTVPLPAGQALAVMAVTNAPAIAASQPLLVPTPGSC